jgi:hypothetical protein
MKEIKTNLINEFRLNLQDRLTYHLITKLNVGLNNELYNKLSRDEGSKAFNLDNELQVRLGIKNNL